MSGNDNPRLRLFLCGDVMTGRGIDQALPHPVNPVLYEPYIRDARAYVDLAEAANGPIERLPGHDDRRDMTTRVVQHGGLVTSVHAPRCCAYTRRHVTCRR